MTTTRSMTLAALLLAASAAVAVATTHDEAADQDEEAMEAEGGEAAAAPEGQAAAIPGTRTLELGFAGLMDRRNREDLEPINLTVGVMESAGEYTLQSGGYYRITVSADGTQEIAVEGPGFFRNIWINEIVINDIEVRPMGGIDSIEFDAAGEARISFIAIRPGQYEMRIVGTTGETQRAAFIIQ